MLRIKTDFLIIFFFLFRLFIALLLWKDYIRSCVIVLPYIRPYCPNLTWKRAYPWGSWPSRRSHSPFSVPFFMACKSNRWSGFCSGPVRLREALRHKYLQWTEPYSTDHQSSLVYQTGNRVRLSKQNKLALSFC